MVSVILTYLGIIYLSAAASIVSSSHISPSSFLDLETLHGSWLHQSEITSMDQVKLFEGGWVWSETGSLLVTHVCRATRDNDITPGELLNGTCYVAEKPTLSVITGVTEFSRNYSVLLKLDDEVYEWVTFDKESVELPRGALVGGVHGDVFEPLFICRRVYNGTAGNVRASKAVLGHFSPRDGKCYYELEFGTNWLKFDLSFSSENFQLLVLRARGPPQCAEPRTLGVAASPTSHVVSHKIKSDSN